MDTCHAGHLRSRLSAGQRAQIQQARPQQCYSFQRISAAPDFMHQKADYTSLLLGRDTLRVVGSSVANSLSSANTEASVTLLRRVLLPALV